MSAPHLTILAPKFLGTHFICKRLRLIFTTKSPTPLLKRCGCGSNYQMSSKYSLFSSSIISNGKHSAQPSGIPSRRSTIAFTSSIPCYVLLPPAYDAQTISDHKFPAVKGSFPHLCQTPSHYLRWLLRTDKSPDRVCEESRPCLNPLECKCEHCPLSYPAPYLVVVLIEFYLPAMVH